MRRRRITLIAFGSTFAVAAIGVLIGGLFLLNDDSAAAIALLVLAAIFGGLSVLWFVLLIVAARIPQPQFSAQQRKNITTYLRVSRLIRASIEGVVGVAFVVVAVLFFVNGGTIGFLILGLGVLLLLLAAMNVWLARRLGRTVSGPSDS